ncbi:unnamed protein product [Ranitomeya imitator]|uniref:THAP4-like heme-binding domain-containing protein n=1 Tax=Ranitomeya imitator TaxID=111125 RepID=A0ABN9L235_9NEOB|nr:unnamed protein product [Ranitomeya imitator]
MTRRGHHRKKMGGPGPDRDAHRTGPQRDRPWLEAFCLLHTLGTVLGDTAYPLVTVHMDVIVATCTPPLNPAVAPLAWMLGTWVSDPPGEGEFPSIPCFRYMEEAVISHVGQPMLNFTFCSSNPETGKPMHRECGFIRVKPGTNHVALICAQNVGVVEVEEGEDLF